MLVLEKLQHKYHILAEEPGVPAEPGGEAEEDLHHPLLRLPHLLLLLASIQVILNLYSLYQAMILKKPFSILCFQYTFQNHKTVV